jgi:LCP family protein required for cell wall assembly
VLAEPERPVAVAEVPIEVEVSVPVEQPPLAAPPQPVAELPPVVVPPRAPEPISPFPRWTREERPTFLLLGVDRRPNEQLARTDSILLANVDLARRRGTAISIPRDLVVSIPGYYADRVNAVYALGESEKRPGGGLGLLRETIERNFGVRIDHHVVVDFGCFRGAVDALGGVQIAVAERIYDPYYPTDDYGYKVVRFEPGPQWLNGERALEYARTRYGDTDFGRMRRQQQLLTALKVRSLQVQSLAVLPQVAGACRGMASDLSLFDLVALGASAREIRQSDITLRVIDERMAVPFVAPSGAAVLMPRWDEIHAMVRSTMPLGRPGLTAAGQRGAYGRPDEAAAWPRGSLPQASGRLKLE